MCAPGFYCLFNQQWLEQIMIKCHVSTQSVCSPQYMLIAQDRFPAGWESLLILVIREEKQVSFSFHDGSTDIADPEK